MIEYVVGGVELVEAVGPLWELLNKHHQAKSIYFKEKFTQFNYDMRKKVFEKQDKPRLIILAQNEKKENIGYIVASIGNEKDAEVESLFVAEKYRGQGIADTLMKKSLNWFEENQAKKMIIGVGFGNEEVFDFYQKYGFYPKVTILERR